MAWKKGQPTWNKGLTKENDDRVLNNSIMVSKARKNSEYCQVYMRSEEYKQKQSDRMKKFWTKEKREQVSNTMSKKIQSGELNHLFLKKKDTLIERLIQQELTKNNIPFTRHEPVLKYRVDILLSNKIVIECDGCFWHGCPNCFPPSKNIQFKTMAKDRKENYELLQNGYKLYRFWEHEIKKDSTQCVQKIIENEKLN